MSLRIKYTLLHFKVNTRERNVDCNWSLFASMFTSDGQQVSLQATVNSYKQAATCDELLEELTESNQPPSHGFM